MTSDLETTVTAALYLLGFVIAPMAAIFALLRWSRVGVWSRRFIGSSRWHTYGPVLGTLLLLAFPSALLWSIVGREQGRAGSVMLAVGSSALLATLTTWFLALSLAAN